MKDVRSYKNRVRGQSNVHWNKGIRVTKELRVVYPKEPMQGSVVVAVLD